MPDDQTARHDTGDENNHRGKNDLPGIHQTESGDCAWSTAARTVFSNSWDKSVVEVLPAGEKNDQAPNSNMIPMHGPAARQRARAHKDQASGAGRSLRCAMIRFSKAYGTFSLMGRERATAISFRSNSPSFIIPPSC